MYKLYINVGLVREGGGGGGGARGEGTVWGGLMYAHSAVHLPGSATARLISAESHGSSRSARTCSSEYMCIQII